jgi:WD40 repeat protein
MQLKLLPTTIASNFLAWHTKFSVDGRFIAASGPAGLATWVALKNSEIAKLHDATYGPITFPADGKGIIAIKGDRYSAEFVVLSSPHLMWVHTKSVRELSWEAGMGREIRDIACSPTTDRLVVARSDGKLSILKVPTLEEVSVISLFSETELNMLYGSYPKDSFGGVELMDLAISFHPDGDTFAVSSPEMVGLFSLRSNSRVGSIYKPRREVADFGFLTHAFSPDGRYFGAGFTYAPVMVWDSVNLQSPKWTADRSGGGYINGIAFAPDSRVLVCGGRGGKLTVYETVGGRALAEADLNKNTWAQDGEILDVDMSKHALIVTCDKRDRVVLWRLAQA